MNPAVTSPEIPQRKSPYVSKAANHLMRKSLLMCGLLSTLLYAAMNILIPMQYDGYSSASQTISELSAVGAPTRTVWLIWGLVYTLLITAFGWGVWLSAATNRHIRVVGGLIFTCGIISFLWPLAPMHQREVLAAGGGTWSDTIHIILGIVTVLLWTIALGFGAAAFGMPFRVYTIATLVILLVFGVLTGMEAPRIDKNLSTPWIGIWERINIGVFMLWELVLALVLLQGQKHFHIPEVPSGGKFSG